MTSSPDPRSGRWSEEWIASLLFEDTTDHAGWIVVVKDPPLAGTPAEEHYYGVFSRELDAVVAADRLGREINAVMASEYPVQTSVRPLTAACDVVCDVDHMVDP